MFSNRIRQAILGATYYLLRNQAADGHWQEYRLPVGPSDAWVTAYAGVALSAVSQVHHPDALVGARLAATWLTSRRSYSAGWGYNGLTGPDADSTAYALALIQAVGLPFNPQDVMWLLARWKPGGGFATYDGPGAWGCAHVDVTPVAFRALPKADQEKLKPELVEYLRLHRRTDGTWPTYWWRNCYYTSYACLSLLRDLGLEDYTQPTSITCEKNWSVTSAFDLALVLGISALQSDWSAVTSALAHKLLGCQEGTGAWAGAMNLRVTDPDCYAPWEHPSGTLYEDDQGFVTTSTALRVLASLCL